MDNLKSYLLKGDFKKKGSLKEIAGILSMGGTMQDVFKLSNQVLEKYYQTSERPSSAEGVMRKHLMPFSSNLFKSLLSLLFGCVWGWRNRVRVILATPCLRILMAQALIKEDPIPYFNASEVFYGNR